MDPFRNGAAGVVSSAKLLRPKDFAELTTIRLRPIALALRARLRRFRWLRNFQLMPQPPLRGGNTPHSTFPQFVHIFYERRFFVESNGIPAVREAQARQRAASRNRPPLQSISAPSTSFYNTSPE